MSTTKQATDWRAARSTATASTWRRAPDLVELVLARAGDPWVELRLGTTELARVRGGGLVILMAPSGAGKTSCAVGFGIAHERHSGPVVVLSAELPYEELAARVVGIQTDSGWEDVLRGRVARSEMERSLAMPRMTVLAREEATLERFDQALAAARADHPDAPILGIADYIQILGLDVEDQRASVSRTMAQLDGIARAHRAVVLCISQMSRANARAARSGEALGAETTDGGAESAAIERFASLTIALGGLGPVGDDGSQSAQISIGKARMGVGDRVYPARYEGRSGRWRIDGAARPAADVRAEARAERDGADLHRAVVLIGTVATSSIEPLTRNDLRAKAGLGRPLAAAAISKLLGEGGLVEVRRRRPRTTSWMIWTRDRAVEAGIPLVGEGPE